MKILKKLTVFFLIIVLSFATFGGCNNSNNNSKNPSVKYTNYDLVKDGLTDYRVVIPEDADDYMNSTLMEFTYFFKLATNLEVVNVNEENITYAADAKLIVLGNCEQLLDEANVSVNFTELGESGFVIKTVDQNVFIAGGYRYGTVNGVYEFMRKTFNYEIYSADEIVIDKEVSQKKLPDLDMKKIPDIEVLIPGTGLMVNDRTAAMRLGYHGYTELDIPVVDAEGKQHVGHSDRFIVPFDEYGAEHSDWFGAADSQWGKQLCYSNEEMYQQVYLPKVKEFVSMFPTRNWFGISQSDNTPLCKCDKCTPEVEKYGSYSGIMVKFANKLAKDLNNWLKEEGSDRVIKVFANAYQETMDPPVRYNQKNGTYTPIDGIKLEENVYVHMALSAQLPPVSIYAEGNGGCYSQIKGWAALNSKISCWSYGQTFVNYFVPTNLYNSMPDIFKLMKEVGCIDFTIQMQVDNLNGTDFYHLKIFLQSKLRWDVNLDINELIEEYFTYYFGDASEEMLEFFNELRVWFSYLEGSLGYGVGQQVSGNENRKFWPKGVLDKFMQHFEDAKKALEPLKTSDPERYTQLVDRIDLESLSYRYLMVNNYDAYYTPTQVTDMQRNIKNDILRFNILKLKDGASGTSDLIYGGWNV